MLTITGRMLSKKTGFIAHGVHICLWMVVVIILAIYSGNLVASLAIKKQFWPFTDLFGLARAQDYQILLKTGTIREDLLKVNCVTVL